MRASTALVVVVSKDGQERVNRIAYEVSVLHALREGLRCKEIWVVGADRYRNPDDDLPRDADRFITDLKDALATALAALDADLGLELETVSPGAK